MESRSTTAALLKLNHEQSLTAKGAHTKRAWKWHLAPAVLAVSDVLLALLACTVAFAFHGLWGRGELTEVTFFAMMSVIAVWVALRALMGLYPGYGLDSVELLRRHAYSVFVALAILTIFATGFHVGDLLSRLMLVLVFFGLLICVPFLRYLTAWVIKRAGLWGKRVVVLSYKETGTNIVEALRRKWELGYDPVAVFDFRLDTDGVLFEDTDHQQALAGVVDVARKQGADTAIFAMPHTRREQLAKLVSLASASFRHVLIIPNLTGVTNSAVTARNLAGTFAVEIKYNLLDPWALRVKRAMDLCATVLGGALALPLLLVLALLVYLESGGPIFYADRRMGRNGSLFSCVKFRTMVPDAEAALQRILEEDESLRKEYARYHKLRDDPRVTKIGRFLRRTSLDELPQLWNVFRGEMSLVGPRPYLPRESREIGMTQSEILRVPPGMTGPWQVGGRNHASFEDRVGMDAYYIRDWSVWLDFIILAYTVKILLRGRGAY